MDNLEKIEKIREKADVSYEEAKEVLEECNGNLLDSIIKLEQDGKIREDSCNEYSTKNDEESETPRNPQEVAESYQNYEKQKKDNEKSFFASLKSGLRFLLRKGCDNRFLVKRHDRYIMQIPVIIMVLLLILAFWGVLIVLAAGLFFGFRYSFKGPDLGKKTVNDAMEKAAQAAEDLKAEAMGTNKEYECEENDKKNTDN